MAKIDHKKLSSELEDIMTRLQTEDVDLDEAVKLYERGNKIIAELESYLESAENTIKKVRADDQK